MTAPRRRGRGGRADAGRRGRAGPLAGLGVAGAVVCLSLWAAGGPLGAQVPTTLPTSPPPTEPPPTTRPPPTTSRPSTTQRPAPTSAPPTSGAEQDPAPAPPAPGTSARPPASGAGAPGPSTVPGAGAASPGAVPLGEPDDPLITSSASGRLPAVFPWLGVAGTVAFVMLLGLQWALTNPSRRGSRTL